MHGGGRGGGAYCVPGGAAVSARSRPPPVPSRGARLGLVGEAGPHLLQLRPRDAEHRGHESVVAGGQGRVAPVRRPHRAALGRAAALNEGAGGARRAAAAGVRVMLGLQRGGGEHGGRQSSQGAVPREGVPRESVLLQLKETKRVEGKEASGTDSTAPQLGATRAQPPRPASLPALLLLLPGVPLLAAARLRPGTPHLPTPVPRRPRTSWGHPALARPAPGPPPACGASRAGGPLPASGRAPCAGRGRCLRPQPAARCPVWGQWPHSAARLLGCRALLHSLLHTQLGFVLCAVGAEGPRPVGCEHSVQEGCAPEQSGA